ncbi:MAG TPA: carbamoyltransferase C-terminal domain-containing protein [Alphaproteobacteria bacterium]
MLILGVHPGYHDASAILCQDYRILAAVQLERLTRRKADGGRFPGEAVDECLAIAGARRADIDVAVLGRGAYPWRYYTHFRGGRWLEGRVREALGRDKMKSMERELVLARRTDSLAIFDAGLFRAEQGLRPDAEVRFYNHHLAHALPTLFHSDWQDALLYTSDGGGDNVQYSHRVFRDGHITTLYGDDSGLVQPLRIDSLGLAYGYATQALGYRINRHEGKLTGLAAYGEPVLYEQFAAHYRVDELGQVHSDFDSYRALRRWVLEIADGRKPADVAASVQTLLEEVTLRAVKALLARHPVRHLGLSGGVFANVRLNQRLGEECGVDEVFVYPAMSDSGLAAGGVLDYLLARDGLDRWLDRRYRLDSLYFGRDWGAQADAAFAADARLERIAGEPVETAVGLIADGAQVAIFTAGMEYGPRALGARSILAAATDAAINDALNARLGRSEFMPFAPVVAEADAAEVFELAAPLAYAARFMTVTCRVRPAWRERIPAVVHVDGTARPQTLRRDWNPLYYDILNAYKRRTGIPVLINTSFNAHEEPIINTPAECAQALADDRVDYVVTRAAVYRRRAGAA